MNIGTRSLLYGAHQIALHPLFVAAAWRKLYGRLPLDPRIWLSFVVHDWGYWGCPNMDGAEGKMHPWRAALWFYEWFDIRLSRDSLRISRDNPYHKFFGGRDPGIGKSGRFCLFHSRSLARLYDEPVSELCGPDKIASFMMPRWLYLTLTRWTGELEEYMAEADTLAGRKAEISIESPEAWFDSVKSYLSTVAETIVAGGDPGVPPTRTRLSKPSG